MSWTEVELASVNLGDKRLNVRCQKTLEYLAETQARVFPEPAKAAPTPWRHIAYLIRTRDHGWYYEQWLFPNFAAISIVPTVLSFP